MSRPIRGVRRDRIIVAPRDRRRAVLSVINGARRTLMLSLFRCDEPAVFAAIRRAVDRGVHVEVLVTARSRGKRKLRRMWEDLEETGADVHPYPDPVVKYHAKYLVADDGPAIVGSMNFTRKCFDDTIDAVVVTRDAAVVKSLKALLRADRDGRALPQDLSPRLIVGPERARQQFAAVIDGATTSIELMDAKLADPVLIGSLEARRAEGVPLKLFEAKRLNGRPTHGKILFVDRRRVVIGSIALRPLSLDFRREVAITVDDPTVVGPVARLFDSFDAAATDIAGARVNWSTAC